MQVQNCGSQQEATVHFLTVAHLTLDVGSAKKVQNLVSHTDKYALFAQRYNQMDCTVNGALISFESYYYFCADCLFCGANTGWMCIGGWWTLPDPVTKLSSCRGNKEEQLSINSLNVFSGLTQIKLRTNSTCFCPKSRGMPQISTCFRSWRNYWLNWSHGGHFKCRVTREIQEHNYL